MESGSPALITSIDHHHMILLTSKQTHMIMIVLPHGVIKVPSHTLTVLTIPSHTLTVLTIPSHTLTVSTICR